MLRLPVVAVALVAVMYTVFAHTSVLDYSDGCHPSYNEWVKKQFEQEKSR